MLRVFSTFSGISAASIAWKPLGFEFVAYAEIEPFACHVLQQKQGVAKPKYIPSKIKNRKTLDALSTQGIPNFGDISQITDEDLRALGRVDVLEGGSPCQAFSVAGLREGLADERGNLMLVFCELAERMRKINGLRYVIWENVKGVLSNGGGTAFGSLLGALSGSKSEIAANGKWGNSGKIQQPKSGRSVSWRVLDARDFGLPQRRERLFVVADFADRRGASETVFTKCDSKIGAAKAGTKKKTEVKSRTGKRAIAVANDNIFHPPVVGTLLASGAGMSRPAGIGSELDFVIVQKLNDTTVARRLHPIECERLQGFPDHWTDVKFKGRPAADSDRYRTIGNSMATPCMKWIGAGLLEYHLKQLATAGEKLVA